MMKLEKHRNFEFEPNLGVTERHMPHIDYAIKTGDLTPAQRRVLQVIERHKNWVWTTSMKDLSDLARWSGYPSNPNPPPADNPIPITEITSETYFPRVRPRVRGKLKLFKGVRTPTVNTVRNALDRLSETKKIWCFELHATRYYASFASRKPFERALKRNGGIPPGYVPELPSEL